MVQLCCGALSRPGSGLLLFVLTGQELLLTGGLLMIALLIGIERCQRSLLWLLSHALLLALSIRTFFAVETSAPLFVLVCGLYGFGEGLRLLALGIPPRRGLHAAGLGDAAPRA
jgi:hypothetical protein